MAKNAEFIKVHKRSLVIALLMGLLVLIPPVIIVSIIVTYSLHIYPGVSIEKIPVGAKTLPEAVTLLSDHYKVPPQINITIQSSSGSKVISLDTKKIEAHYEYDKSVQSAYAVGRSGNILEDLGDLIVAAQKPTTISLPLSYNKDQFQAFIGNLSQEVGTPPAPPRYLLKNGDIQIENGHEGDVIPADYAEEKLLAALTNGETHVILTTKIVKNTLTSEEIQKAVDRGRAILEKHLALTLSNEPVQVLKVDKLLPFLNPQGGYNSDTLRMFGNSIAQQYNQEVKEPVFNFDGKRVQEFSPGEPGVVIAQDSLFQNMLSKLSKIETSQEPEIALDIPHEQSNPKTDIANVNNLGIKELIGKGTSRFSGSIRSRIHNVALASSRINGVLVAPGNTFSFAEAIGDVSKYTGYQEAYIIQNGRTILGDGGGVCQVSTTLFRAVMNAGLPIVERHAHAYRVGYYEQDSSPGLDATVYVPSVDFKFKNDTSNYILVQTSVDTKNLTAEFRIYGTSDGRKATVSKPVVADQIAPPEDLYTDDPTLPVGVVNQVEHKAWGARVSFNYSVERDGVSLFQKTFVSVYQPWRAVFLKGTKV